MGTERIVKLIGQSPSGEAVIEHEDGRLERVKDRTDWARIDALTDDEIEQAARSDPDWDGLLDIDWSQVEITRPARKQPISIRLDEDVLDFFKRGGTGYQKRINAVLRSYMSASKQRAKAKSPARRRSG
ncbi:BrnA antitoxin of type II toxin-antitoxin system [Bosea sp. CRIB-10]|uniref:BrnA antitoxin family protein n=1 Tax=Bosea sp. CRIB-10 TaxID=378404 RepID=UPI0008F07549|nr:BrnA antitoxin family protein [Bosea sp. CRIB-10]SFC11656.1 BrnA antitoxin of type II toxin-antitoxin system [Bosea sp. CRIB-10]